MTQHTATTGALLRESFRAMMKTVNTAVPGYVVSFEPSTNLAQIQIGIKQVSIKGVTSDPPLIIECPVQFGGGKQFIIEHQIDVGTEGMLIFSQRCIDAWIDTGGIAENPIPRLHNLNDAMFIPGLRSQINVITDFQNDGIRLRNKDGTNHIWLKNDGTAEINITTLTVNGNLVVNGDVDATGNVSATDGEFSAANFNTHVHPAGTPPGTTGTPQ